jgi:c-di-AMP phosphodiesterase-like protein
MHDRFEKLKIQIITGLIAQVIVLFAFFMFLFNWAFAVLLVFFVIDTALLGFLLYRYQVDLKERVISITRILGKEAKDALLLGGIGLITYDENHVVTWANELFEERGMYLIGERITNLDPKINELFMGESESISLTINEHTYQISRKENAHLLFVKDISEFQRLKETYNNEQVVIGYVHLDNYEETTQYEEEQAIAYIDAKIRQPVVEWAKNHSMFVRRVKSDRFLIVLNERVYNKLVEERFNILDYIRETSHQMDITITLSMAFAKGSSDFLLLDEMANSALELAQSRGGDQVAIKQHNKEIVYFGGNSQAQEKRSKVRVRVMAHSIKELLIQASQIVIVSHKEMDFDCMGAALALSRIANALSKPVYIISKSGGVEEKLSKSIIKYKDHLEQRHRFISENEAVEMYNDQMLVVMIDHHKGEQSNGAALIEIAKKVVVIDHHRRAKDFDFNPMLVYIESSASSVSELITELLPYFALPIDLSGIESTMMLTGLMVDTNRFRNRTGSRTFEAASALKAFGADPVEADSLLKDEFNEFELKTNILSYATYLDHGVVVVPYIENKAISRTLMSQVADMLLNIQGVEASFVCAKVDGNVIALSARSKGTINVQVIMEALKGGGHFTAAAVQKENTTVEEVIEELKAAIDDYFHEED